MKKPLISIIVPVYNVEKYILRCIHSITNQSYQNYELLLIDDGSSDTSYALCREEAEKNDKITLIRKTNEGSGYARNTGIDIARGNYLLFVDSDDYLLDKCLERIVSVALKENCDIVQFKYIEGYLSNYKSEPKENSYIVCNSKQAFCSKDVNVCIWGKLVRLDLIKNIRYPKVSVHDDEFITYKIVYGAKKIVVLDEYYYYHYKNPASLMRQKRAEMPFNFFTAFSERLLFFKEMNEPFLVTVTHKEFASRLMFAAMSYDLYSNSRYSFRELFRLFKHHYTLGKNAVSDPGEKILFAAFRYMPHFMKYLYRQFKAREFHRLN